MEAYWHGCGDGEGYGDGKGNGKEHIDGEGYGEDHPDNEGYGDCKEYDSNGKRGCRYRGDGYGDEGSRHALADAIGRWSGQWPLLRAFGHRADLG